MSYPREVKPPENAESHVWCRECGLGNWERAIQTSPDSYRGLTMFSGRFDREAGRDTGICELCYEGETLHDLAARREREERGPR